ncbi:hypothetical protein THAOC_12260 [Thalassiosira oceanica]|uniref:Cyclin-like domain-containing protein n=1 Tax=Thalassiosira oceanica TaxID=159749 RepID=K0T8I5_THAOC|nr:hypothetical protein THAOC_12260 [Thalassiosira oceanica]|eukprot:EJK66782.1 hypothetical protein THAOC_12260 [Thalassiosira oceanica]
MVLSETTTSTTEAALSVMLEKEQHSYQRSPPNPLVPLAEYTQDRPLLVNWCRRLVGQGNFRSPGELVQTAMALADKYMSGRHLRTYMKDHYQLIVVACLNIAMKTDSPAKAPSYKELSGICQGAYTPEEIASEEMCILQILAWYVHPPTASQVANHILAIVKDSTTFAGRDWELLVDRVHQLIDVSILDLDLSVRRPSTVAMAAILVSAKALDGRDIRQRTLRATFFIMNMLDFDSACEIDSIHTNLSYIDKKCVLGMTEPRTSQGKSPQSFRAVTPSQAQMASPSVQFTDHQVHGRHDIIGSTLELRTSARLPAPRASMKFLRLDNPLATVEVASSCGGGADIRREGGKFADNRRVDMVPSPSSASKRSSSTPEGGTRRTRAKVQPHSPLLGLSQGRTSMSNGNARVSSSPLTAALVRRASLDAAAKDGGAVDSNPASESRNRTPPQSPARGLPRSTECTPVVG